MSKNIEQLYIANPASSMNATDLMYLGRSPYNTADDFAITFANFVASIGTATPTASTIAQWDANKNLSANNFLSGYTSTVTAAGTTVLTVGSTQQQYFTGTTTQTVTLPVVSTLVKGFSFTIVNNSTGVLTINSSGNDLVESMASFTQLVVTCVEITGTTAASWDTDYTADILPVPPTEGGTGVANLVSSTISVGGAFSMIGAYTFAGTLTGNTAVTFPTSGTLATTANTVSSITGTTNEVIVSASTGAVILSLPQPIAPTSSVEFASLQLSGGVIYDVNGNIIFQMNAAPSAVNHFTIDNSAAGNAIDISVVGTDTNIGLNIVTKGTGVISFETASTVNQYYFYTGAGIVNVFNFPNTGTAWTYTYPAASGTLALTSQFQTWTPVITFATPGNLSVAYTSQYGYYSKVGSIVTVSWYIAFTPTYTTASGAAQITGLPFANNSTAGNLQWGSLINNGTFTYPSGSTNLASAVQNGASIVGLYGTGATSGAATLTTTNFPSGVAQLIFGQLTYLV